MSELYWITRCDPINAVALALLIISFMALVVFIALYLCGKEDGDENVIKTGSKMLKIITPIFAISLLIRIFVPTTEEALAIYGIGVCP